MLLILRGSQSLWHEGTISTSHTFKITMSNFMYEGNGSFCFSIRGSGERSSRKHKVFSYSGPSAFTMGYLRHYHSFPPYPQQRLIIDWKAKLRAFCVVFKIPPKLVSFYLSSMIFYFLKHILYLSSLTWHQKSLLLLPVPIALLPLSYIIFIFLNHHITPEMMRIY